MAVAVKNMPETTTQTRTANLAASSLLGAIYVLAALAVLSVGVPKLWASGVAPWLTETLGSFVSGAGLIIVELFALGVLAMLGLTLVGGQPAPGLKAGVFVLVAGILLTAIIVSWFTATRLGDAVAVGVGIVLVFFGGRFVTKPSFPDAMQAFEAQGWFSIRSYKPNQGKRVRRATLLGILVLCGSGIYTLLHHHTLDTVRSRDWQIGLPFLAQTVTILPDVKFTVPILLAAAAIWLSYRLINVPTFAEFLIATEGELNKVAWPTRRSLIQDTIVVLSTVVLMTVFLFLVDVAWGQILSSRYIAVLQFDPKTTEPKDIQEPDW